MLTSFGHTFDKSGKKMAVFPKPEIEKKWINGHDYRHQHETLKEVVITHMQSKASHHTEKKKITLTILVFVQAGYALVITVKVH